ncbi:hypothetical protein [Paraburkholderia lycopersici]|uniref:Uncharacterized protein n=1 Tax=Paraburkholderia lycopersici TaxID=416944 RepID=A0A1G6M9Y8_9BURK|nr:hypothetical protein [Paraburkholderia lycopersici]SDC52280.1 hypothetical protein SAMN05421548_107173 [Paraburkholderia lycopersici]
MKTGVLADKDLHCHAGNLCRAIRRSAWRRLAWRAARAAGEKALPSAAAVADDRAVRDASPSFAPMEPDRTP